MTVLAIDQGTSATKAIVVDDDGSVIGEATAAVAPVAGPGGAVTQDPDALYQSILMAGRAALAACGHPPLAAIGIGNQGETVLAWDRTTGRPSGAAIGWQDRRAATVTARLAGEAQRLTELTGLPLDPYFAAPKLAWLREQQVGGQMAATPDAPGAGGAGGADGAGGAGGAGAAGGTGGTGGRVMTTIDAWVTHRLTGAYVTDIATASRTMLLDLDRGEWSPQAGAAFGIDVGAQPAIVGCAEVVGETDAFGRAVPVAALIVDQQAALYGQGCDEPGDAKCTYGTGAFLLANAGTEPPRSAAGLSTSVAWRLPGEATRYCLDGQLYTVGAAVRWLAALGLIGGPEELDGIALREPEELPLFVPGLAGLGAPEWAPDARGGWLDLALDTGRDELVGAVLWGIAAQVARLAHAIENDTGRPLRSLRVDGGLTRSRRLMQIQADLLGLPVAVASSPDATAHGIAALARIGVGGGLPAHAEAPTPVAVFEPRLERSRAAAYLARHAAATAATVGLVSGG